MTKNIVVTGGCGYIGSHVARAFKQHGDHVTVIDRVQRNHTLKDIDGYFIGDVASDGARAVEAARAAPGRIATLILPADTAWNPADGPATARAEKSSAAEVSAT